MMLYILYCRITLVHPGKNLLETMSTEFPPLIEKKMKEVGINIILNDRVTSHENGKVTLASGNTEGMKLSLLNFYL